MNLLTIFDHDNYQGILVVSDIHAMLPALLGAVSYAEANNLFLVFLGDFIDGGPEPAEVVSTVRKLLENKKCATIIGNHEDKMYRYFIGNPVKLGNDQLDTLHLSGHVSEQFRSDIIAIHSSPFAKHYLYIGKTIITHGAVHPGLWKFPENVSPAQKAMSLYGEVNGTRDNIGFPVRTYSWVNEIPAGHQAVIGHDRSAMGKSVVLPMVVKNSSGGKTFFTDTSCGKKMVTNGFATGTVFLFRGVELDFAAFKAFR